MIEVTRSIPLTLEEVHEALVEAAARKLDLGGGLSLVQHNVKIQGDWWIPEIGPAIIVRFRIAPLVQGGQA